MKCPLDQSDLLITERQGVEIDYCPTCRGVWLDRGELDKLIDRAEKYDRRDRSHDDDDDDRDRQRNRLPYEPPRGTQAPYPAPNAGRAPGADIAGMVGDVLKKKLDERQRGGYDRDDYRHHGHKKKKGGLLGELFDF